MDAPTVTAPGKLFLAGEYAVLDGGAAVVAAISRRATGRFAPGLAPASSLVAEAVRAAREALRMVGAALPAGTVEVDTTALSSQGHKLGLGSSAAAAVVAVGAAFEAAGVSLSAGPLDALAVAARAHHDFQRGAGSGADVLAAGRGGLLAIQRRADGALAARTLPALPCELVVFWTGRPSATGDRLRAVERLRRQAPAQHGARLRELGDAAAAFLGAVEGADGPRLIAACRQAHAAMDALGRAADVPIVTPPFSSAAALAAELGGAAKASGAGGGDVGVGFFLDRAAADAFRRRAATIDLTILDLSIDPIGVSRHDGNG